MGKQSLLWQEQEYAESSLLMKGPAEKYFN